MQAVLVMFRSDGDRRSFSLTRDITVVGRREDCDLRIPLGEVSRKHCRMVRDGDSLRLEDLGSSNGTFHNGQRVQEATLSPGDSIQVGPLVFVLQVDGVPGDDDLAPMQPQALDSQSAGLPEDGPVRSMPPGETGLQELPTIDEGLEPLDSLEPLSDEDAGFEVMSDDDKQAPHGGLELSDEQTHLENKPKSRRR